MGQYDGGQGAALGEKSTGSGAVSGNEYGGATGTSFAGKRSLTDRLAASGDRLDSEAAAEKLLTVILQELNGGRSYKVLLKAFLVADEKGVVRQVVSALHERPHPQFVNYFAYFMTVLAVDGGEPIAEYVLGQVRACGIHAVKLTPGQGEAHAEPAVLGAGLGAVISYEGRTFVRLGEEPFYISGKPPSGSWVPRSGSTSVIFVSRANAPNKVYRLDYDVLKQGPRAGQKGWEHNQKGVAKVLGLRGITNHTPAGALGRAAGTAVLVFKWGGRAMFVLGAIAHAVEIWHASDKVRAGASAAGSLALGAAGAGVGASAGAAQGARLGPWGAVAGAGLGAMIGGAGGAKMGEVAAQYVYDSIFAPLEVEEWVIVEGEASAHDESTEER